MNAAAPTGSAGVPASPETLRNLLTEHDIQPDKH